MIRNFITVIMLTFFIVNATETDSIQINSDSTLIDKSDTVFKTIDTTAISSALKQPEQKPDTLDTKQSSIVPDTLPPNTSSSIKIHKRKYNHREQIIFASVMMFFIAIVIASADNWNPD